jgi:hypothetical protein
VIVVEDFGLSQEIVEKLPPTYPVAPPCPACSKQGYFLESFPAK